MINICYTADQGYAMQVAVSMVSMLENNPDEDLCFYVLANNYSADTKGKYKKIEERYSCKVFIVDITEKMRSLLQTEVVKEPGAIRNGVVSFMYARLFIGSAIPETIDKLIYIDSDTLYINKIRDLYDIEIKEGYIYAAVRDLWPNIYNRVIGLKENDLYFQSGIMLVDMKKWREQQCESRILGCIANLKHYYSLHDQDILNVCFHGKIQTLPLEFGMVYFVREYSAEQIRDLAGKSVEQYYSNDEIKAAKSKPYVIHYAGDYFGRPWIYPRACKDSRLWLSYFKLTPWDEKYLANKYHPAYGIKYFTKKVLFPFTKSLWLKNVKRRFYKEIEKMKNEDNFSK